MKLVAAALTAASVLGLASVGAAQEHHTRFDTPDSSIVTP